MNRYGQTTSYLMCRTMGHAWDVITADRMPRLGGEPVWMRCERCHTVRRDAVDTTSGRLLARQYVYDDSYRHAFDTAFADAAPTRSDYRRMLLAEHIVKQRAARAHEQRKDGHAA